MTVMGVLKHFSDFTKVLKDLERVFSNISLNCSSVALSHLPV